MDNTTFDKKPWVLSEVTFVSFLPQWKNYKINYEKLTYQENMYLSLCLFPETGAV